jgi:DNA primase
MPKDVDLIKERLDIVELVRSYVTLTPAGKNLKGLCPFHQEKTPSFIVSPERKTWHCFGCGEGGDVISFVMKYEHLEFPEALRFLAERAGIELQHVNPQAERELGVLYGLHEAATAFYRGELAKSAKAREYLASRTFTQRTIDEFSLGFAPGGEALTLHLLKAGHAVEDVVRAGLAGKTASGLYRDRFQSRIVFPIENQVGKVVAFTGRVLPVAPGSVPPSPGGVEPPKYLNSPETPIFNKSKVLYGFSKTKGDIARSRAVVLMEGQMDFLLAWQSGVTNGVAVSGTGLTREHLERLRRIADTVYVSFDNDAAGVKALERSLDVFAGYDFHLKGIELGTYKDPGEACEKDPSFLARAVAAARPAFEQLMTHLFAAEPDDIAARKRIVRGLLQKVRHLKSAAEQTAWLREITVQSGISEVSLLTELAEIPTDEKPGTAEVGEYVPPAPKRVDLIAARLLSLAFTKPDFSARVKEIKDLLPEVYRSIVEHPESAEAGFLEMQSSVLVGSDQKEIEEEFTELIRQLTIERLRGEQAMWKERVRLAEGRGDDAAVAAAEREFTTVSKKLNDTKNQR